MRQVLLVLGLASLIVGFQMPVSSIQKLQSTDCQLYYEQMQKELENGMQNWDFEGANSRAQFKQLLRTCVNEAKSCEEKMVSSVLLKIDYGLSYEDKFDSKFYFSVYQSAIQNCYQVFNVQVYQDFEQCEAFFDQLLSQFDMGEMLDFENQQSINEFIQGFAQCAQFAITCEQRVVQEILNKIAHDILLHIYDKTKGQKLYDTLISKCQARVSQILQSDVMLDEKKCHEIFETIRYSRDMPQTLRGLYSLTNEQKKKCVQVYENPKSCYDYATILLLKELLEKNVNMDSLALSIKNHYETCSSSIFGKNLQTTPEVGANLECQRFEVWMSDETIKNEEKFDCEEQSDKCSKLYAYNQQASLSKMSSDHTLMKSEYKSQCERRKALLVYLNYGVQSCEKLIQSGTIYLQLNKMEISRFAQCSTQLKQLNNVKEEAKDATTISLDVTAITSTPSTQFSCNITDQAYLNSLKTLENPLYQLNSLENTPCYCKITSDTEQGYISGLSFKFNIIPVNNFANTTYNDIFYGLRFMDCSAEVLRSPIQKKQGEQFLLEIVYTSSSLLSAALLSLITFILFALI